MSNNKRQKTIEAFYKPQQPSLSFTAFSQSLNNLSSSSESSLPFLLTVPIIVPRLPASVLPQFKDNSFVFPDASKKVEWTENPRLFSAFHEVVKQSNYSFRSAAKQINQQYYPKLISKEIKASTIQYWYYKMEENSSNCNQGNRKRTMYQLKEKFVQYVVSPETVHRRKLLYR